MTKEYETNAERAARLEREAKARENATRSDHTTITTRKTEKKQASKKEGE